MNLTELVSLIVSKVSVFAKNAGQKWRNLNKAEKLNYNKMAENDLSTTVQEGSKDKRSSAEL